VSTGTITLPPDAGNEGGAIRARLLAPVRNGDLAALCDSWFHTDITWRIAGCSAMADDPAFAGKLRGAFGTVLKAGASPQALAKQPCPWDPPCGFEVLFRKQGRMSAGLDLASPWVVAIDRMRSHLSITLRVFGFACDYLPAAAEAMTQAIAGRCGLEKLAPGNCVTIESRRFASVDHLVHATEPRALTLDFMSPVSLSGQSVLHAPHVLIGTLPARIETVARWMDMQLIHDRDAYRVAAQMVDLHWEDTEKCNWMRWSGQQGRQIPMSGLRGRLHIRGAPAALAVLEPALRIGAFTHCGADIAFGLGRYMLLDDRY
jgi:hypothetical protein